LGKTPGKDKLAGKLTYPALYGLEKSQELAKESADNALNALSNFDDKADPLRDLVSKILSRKS
ncbi:MAG: hypothetical protein LBG64_03905, partial [Pseudomonadales bacterium]|jgi:geranylgeranyl diphosphate synthase type II|nr:hypothetical protein [Pseudomonadales bacterium]